MRAQLAPEPECARAGSVSLSSGDLAGLMDVDGFGQLPRAPGQQRPRAGGADHGSANKRVSLTNAQAPGNGLRALRLIACMSGRISGHGFGWWLQR